MSASDPIISIALPLSEWQRLVGGLWELAGRTEEIYRDAPDPSAEADLQDQIRWCTATATRIDAATQRA